LLWKERDACCYKSSGRAGRGEENWIRVMRPNGGTARGAFHSTTERN
jgi:hypothetical protein